MSDIIKHRECANQNHNDRALCGGTHLKSQLLNRLQQEDPGLRPAWER
jgi:hypothetical protein